MLALCDGDTPLGCSNKRISKSVSKTVDFLDKCQELTDSSTELASCSLITVASYSCLALLSGVLLVKLYSFVMVKAGKAEAGSDPLAKVS